MTTLPIPIPQGFKISAKSGQKVSVGDTIAIKEDESSDLLINVSQDLGIEPKKVAHSLSKKPGERIEVGDLIAKKGGILGSREIHSKVAGTILKLDENEGTLTIRTQEAIEEDSEIKITSPIDGTIDKVEADKIAIKTEKEAILALEGSGENAFGEVELFEEELKAADLDDKVFGKILIAHSFSRETIAKAIGLGAIALIAQEIRNIDLENLKEKLIKTPVLRVAPESFRKIAHRGGKIIADAKNLVIIKL